MINPNKKLWKWGPIDGHPLHTTHFMEAMSHCKDKNGISWSDALFHMKDGKMFFVSDFNDLYQNGEEMFRTYILNKKNKMKVYNKWLRIKG